MSNPAHGPAETRRLSFEITSLGKAALAWEDPLQPTVISQKSRDEKGTIVGAKLGADIDDVHREDGVEVVLTDGLPYEPETLTLGIRWAHGFHLQSVSGLITAAQLEQMIEVLTAANAEAERVGLWVATPSDAAIEGGEPDLSEESDEVSEVCRSCGVLFDPISNRTQRCNECGG